MAKIVFKIKNKVQKESHFLTLKLTTKLCSARVPTQLIEERTVLLMSGI